MENPDYQLTPEEAIRLELTCFYIKAALGSGQYSTKPLTGKQIDTLIDSGTTFTSKLLKRIKVNT